MNQSSVLQNTTHIQKNLLPIFQSPQKSQQQPELNSLVYNQIWEIKHFLSQVQCKALIACSEEVQYKNASMKIQKTKTEIQNSLQKSTIIESKEKQVRNMKRAIIEDEISAIYLGKLLEPYISLAQEGGIFTGLNNKFRFQKYEQGDSFNIHIDGQLTSNETVKSLFSVLIFLNTVEKGGEINFYDHTMKNQVLSVAPELGKILIYRQKG